MIRAFHVGTTGAIEHQKKMAVSSNNMANANTNGYKSERLTFQELLYQRVRMPDNYNTTDREYSTDEEQERMEAQFQLENKLRVGVGARGNETALSFVQGSFATTNSYLDYAIEGSAFFAIEGYEGDMYYTRNGTFAASIEGDEAYLVTSNGGYVLDADYNRILLPSTEDIVSLIPSFVDITGANEAQVGLFTCPNVYGLALIGQNRFIPTEFSGEMSEAPETVKLVNNVVEMSNVNLAEEMVRVIEAQRAFQSNLTVIRTADDIESYTIQMKT